MRERLHKTLLYLGFMLLAFLEVGLPIPYLCPPLVVLVTTRGLAFVFCASFWCLLQADRLNKSTNEKTNNFFIEK